MDWYAVLGVSPQATAAEIKQAFRTAALQLHPDKTGGGSGDQFAAIREAFLVLSDERQREAYDAQFGSRTRESDEETEAKRAYFAEKLFAQEQFGRTEPPGAAHRGTLRSELPDWWAALQSTKPRTVSGRTFETLHEAREFVDSHPGEKLLMQHPTEYSRDYENYTLNRLKRRNQ